MTQGITREDALALARASRGTGEQAPDPARARALALARAAREYPEPGFGDYLAEFGASAVESVAGTLRGFGSIADAMRRNVPGIDALDVQIGEGEESVFSTAGEAVGELAPETHPGAQYTFPGQVAGVAGGVGGFLAQAALIPGGAVAKTLGAGVGMSASSFEQGQQRALAEGASQDDADIAGLATMPAGAIQALPIGRAAARIVGPLANAVSKSILGGAAANAAEFVGVNAVGKGWSEYVAQEIRDEAEAKEVWDAAFSGTLPEVVVGFMLGGAATWRANKRGARLSEQALAEVEAAGVEVARNLAARRDAAGDAADGAADGGDEFVARPPPGSDPDRSGDGDPDAPDALGPIELGPDGPDGAGGAQMTRIEAPDDATAAVVERFSRSIKWKTPLEIHEAPVRLRERAARVGMKLVGVKGEEPLPGEGYYDRETGTAIIDLGGEGGPKRMEDVLRHEINHHAEKTRPELAKAWADALDEIAPGWTEHAAKARSKAQKLAKLPGLSKEGAEEEGRSEAAEGLGTILDVLDAQPDLVAQVAAHKPGMLRTLADFLIDFANKIRGSKDKSISAKVRELQAVLELHGSDIEKSVGAEGASRLALKLRDLHAALAVEESVEQPRANKKANEFLAPIESAEVQGPQPKATKRAGLRAGMPAHDIVGALSDISRRIEDALLAGESLDAPRLRELRKDRTTAEGLLYEADPTHAALSREDPVAIWKRIVAEDETATTERRKQAEKRGVAIGRAHEAFEADVKRNTDKRQREKMGQEVAYERAFQKMLAEEEQAATKRADDERADDAKARKGELKALRDDIRSRVKPEPKAKKATKAKAQVAADTKRQDVLAAHYARIAERKAEEAANPREPEPVAPEPEKKKLPVRWKREKLDDPRLKDEVVRDELGAMIHGAKWMIVGGTKDMPGGNRDSDKHYIRHKWTAEQDWVRMRANAGFKFNLEETKRIIKDALADRVLTANERLYATWLIDTAHESAFRGADTPEDMARAREFYLDEKIRRGERPIGENESLPDAGAQEDVPFALPIKTREAAAHQAELEAPQGRLGRLGRLGRQGRLERFLEPIRAGAERNAVRRLIWAEGNSDQAFPVSVEGAKTNLVVYGFPLRPPGLLSERMVRLQSLARLFIEQELNLDTETKQREWDSLEPFEFQPSARRDAYEAELRERNGWMETFQGALRDGETDAAAARLAAAAHPEALKPSRFLAGFDDPAFDGPAFALPLRRREQTDTPEFKAWFKGSKVADEHGNPLVMYHGTGSASFNEFDSTKSERFGWGLGFHFASNPDQASSYAGQWDGLKDSSVRVIPAYLNIKNPLDGEEYHRIQEEVGESMPVGVPRHPRIVAVRTRDRLMSEGYDGVRYWQNDQWLWTAFSSNQIKSATGNVGAFGQRAPTAQEASQLGMTEERALAAQGRGDIRFALPGGKGRDGSGLREFLARYEGGDPHYAVTSKGKLTIAAREASEQFWEKETISKTQTARGAREMLATKAGKTEVDAAIRGQHPGDWREQSTLTVAAEMRVNNLLRAAAQGTTNARAAIGLAVDYFMLRSEQGRALSAVQRPRTPRESFWQEMSEPTPDNAKALKKLQNQLRVTSTPEAKAKIRERIEEIKADEARLFDKGMLALRKAGIDPETMADTPAQAAHAFRVANIAKSKGFWDWLLELRASGLVSSPATTVGALGGNVLNVGWNTVLARIAELPVPGGATAGEIRAITAALPGAWNKGLRAFWNVVTTDAPTYEAQLKQLGLIDQAQNFENAKLASIPGIPGRLVRGIGLTPMTAVDEFARAMGSELEAVAIAHRRSGGDPAQMRRLLGSTEVWSEAVKNTRRNIFQETDENALVTTGFKVREALDHLGGNTVPVGHLIFPFVRTGVNGVLEALRKLPGPAQIVAAKHIIKGEWKGDPELRARDVSAQILSVVVGTTLWQLANMEDEKGRPYITGSQPGTRAQKSDAWKTAPPMSYRVGDQWRSYRKWMPFALMTAAVLDAAQDGVDPMSVVLSLGAQAVDATYLSTLSSLLDAVQSEAPTSDKIAQVGDDFARSFIPNLVRSGLAAKKDEVTIDPLRAKGGKELGWTDRARAYTGTLESEQQYDNWGRPMEKGGNVMERWLSPSPPNRRIAWHAADQTIAAWNDNLPEGESPWVPSKAQYWYTVRGVTKYMSPKQSSAFQRRAGELAAGMLDESTLDPKNPTRAQIDRIKKALSRARSRARREVLNEIPDEEEDG